MVTTHAVRTPLPKKPIKLAPPDVPEQLKAILPHHITLAGLLGMQPHEVYLLWQGSQSNENPLVLDHIKRLFTAVKLSDPDFAERSKDLADIIRSHQQECKRIELVNQKREMHFVQEMGQFKKDSHEQFNLVHRAYHEFMLRLNVGIRIKDLTNTENSLITQMRHDDREFGTVLYHKGFFLTSMVRGNGYTPRLTQSTKFYGHARMLILDSMEEHNWTGGSQVRI